MTAFRYLPPRTKGAESEHYAPGEAAQRGNYQPGDFILTHSKGLIGRIIRFGQSLRYLGRNRGYAWWSHAALIVSHDGRLIEALGGGVQVRNISEYANTDYQLVRLGALADRRDRAQIVRYARWALGQRYGFLTIASIALSLLTGGKFTFGFDGQSICSGLVARALERSNAIFDRSPSHIMPADLARFFPCNGRRAAPPEGRFRPRPRA